MLYKRNLNKRNRFEPVTIGLIIGAVVVGVTVVGAMAGAALAFSIYFLVGASMRPDVTIPVIYPD